MNFVCGVGDELWNFFHDEYVWMMSLGGEDSHMVAYVVFVVKTIRKEIDNYV